MPEMGLEKLEARLYDLRQDISDTMIADCKRYLDGCFHIDIEVWYRRYTLLKKMVVIAGDIQVSLSRYLTLASQGMDLAESHKKLVKEYTLVKDE